MSIAPVMHLSHHHAFVNKYHNIHTTAYNFYLMLYFVNIKVKYISEKIPIMYQIECIILKLKEFDFYFTFHSVMKYNKYSKVKLNNAFLTNIRINVVRTLPIRFKQSKVYTSGRTYSIR